MTVYTVYAGVSKSFRTGCLELELQMVKLPATRCSCSLVSFAAVTLRVASRVFIVVSVHFFIDSVRKLLDTPSYKALVATRRNEDFSGDKPCRYRINNSTFRRVPPPLVSATVHGDTHTEGFWNVVFFLSIHASWSPNDTSTKTCLLFSVSCL